MASKRLEQAIAQKALLSLMPKGVDHNCPQFRACTSFLDARKLFRRPFERQDAVFIGERGRLSRSGIHRRFTYWIKEADLSPKLSFHSLRHGYATRLLDGGVSLASVREQLGHSNISVTSTYLHFTEAARARILEVT